MNLNRADVIGNLTREPELKTTATGKVVATFSVATNNTWTDQAGVKQENAEYHNIVAWGKLADICGKYLKKGSKVFASGRLQTREWEGQDGAKRNRTEIVLSEMIMLDSKGGGDSQEMSNIKDRVMNIPPPAKDPTKVDEILPENIPF